MTPIEEKLYSACKGRDVMQVKALLERNPAFNVNHIFDDDGNTTLHFACRDGRHEIVSVLLAHSQINVNQQKNCGDTPFLLGCVNNFVPVVKVLLKDSRLDVNLADNYHRTALWYASRFGQVEVIKWMIALRGHDLDFDKKGKSSPDGGYYPAIEIARNKNKHGVTSLLGRFMASAASAQHEIQVELEFADAQAADLFAKTIFLCDGLLKIKTNRSRRKTTRFFAIVQRLPMELQMILCHIVYNSGKERIRSKDSEPALRSLAKRTRL
jgi:hypothetical protein